MSAMRIKKDFTTQNYKRTNSNEITTSLQVGKPLQRLLTMRQVNLVASYTGKKNPTISRVFVSAPAKN
jgi:hypothetical protein